MVKESPSLNLCLYNWSQYKQVQSSNLVSLKVCNFEINSYPVGFEMWEVFLTLGMLRATPLSYLTQVNKVNFN